MALFPVNDSLLCVSLSNESFNEDSPSAILVASLLPILLIFFLKNGSITFAKAFVNCIASIDAFTLSAPDIIFLVVLIVLTILSAPGNKNFASYFANVGAVLIASYAPKALSTNIEVNVVESSTATLLTLINLFVVSFNLFCIEFSCLLFNFIF